MDLDLGRLLRTQSPDERKVLIENLFSSQIEPIVKKTIRIKFNPALQTTNDAEDISNETLLRLWKQLQKWLQNPEQVEVSDLSGYVVATTLNCCKEYLRNKFPRRWHLRNRLRYLLTESRGWDVWKSTQDDWLAGHSSWKHRDPVKKEDVLRLMGQMDVIDKARSCQGKLEPVVDIVFQHAKRPLLLDDLVAIVISLPGFREQFQDVQMQEDARVEDLADPSTGLLEFTHQQAYLQSLWSEICALPLNQRSALLLNLRDAEGRDAITVFPVTGTASISTIADALGIPAEEFARLWNDLPLHDAQIAERLRLSRQQVINLRKAARERLAYRMSKVRR